MTILAPCLPAKQAVFCGILEFDTYERLIPDTSGHEVASEIAPQRELGRNVSWRANRAIEESKVRTKLSVPSEEGQKMSAFPTRVGAEEILEIVDLLK